jgi:hypothetical protein
LRRGGDLIAHRSRGNPACNHGNGAHGLTVDVFVRGNGMETEMQNALILTFAASIMLGMWVIWRITP